jgi:hypothetical protein
VGTVYLISGLLVYLLVVALITQVLKQNNVPAVADRRVGDRRQNAESRRKGPRSSSGETRRVSDRRSMYAGALA